MQRWTVPSPDEHHLSAFCQRSAGTLGRFAAFCHFTPEGIGNPLPRQYLPKLTPRSGGAGHPCTPPY